MRLARPFYAVVAVLVVIGVAAAYLLIPRQRELAEIYRRGNEYAAARTAYEAQLANGALPLSIVVPLADVYIYFGQINHAIRLLERYAAAYPDNAEILRRLAEAYGQNQQMARKMETLRKLDRVKPNTETLRDVLDDQRDRADSDGEMATLARLVERPDSAPEDATEYAELLAARGEYRNAVAVLEKRMGRGPKALDYGGLELLCSLLLDLSRPDDARKYAAQFLEGNTDPAAIGAITSLFITRGRADIALRLIEPFQAHAADNPQLLDDVIQVERAAGRATQALARLQKLDDEGRLPQSMYVPYVELAVEASDRDHAYKGLERVDPGAFQHSTLTGLIELSLQQGDVTRAAALAKRAGDDIFVEAPMVAAKLALAQGDQARAQQWVKRAEAMSNLPAHEIIALARYEAEHGQAALARRRANALAQSPVMTDSDLPSLASLFITLGVKPADVTTFDTIRLQRPSPRADAAWALVATAAGHSAAVREWLEKAQGLDEQTLYDLFYAARDAGQSQLAFLAAERLYRASASPRNITIYGQALTDIGRAAEALQLLRPLLPGDRELQTTYLNALAKAYAAGAPVRDELVAYATKQINDPSLTADERGGVAAALVSAGAYDVALPMLANLARTQRGNWFWTYIDAAKKAKRTAELENFLKAELARSDLSKKEREDRLYALLDLSGGAAAALPYLKAQAESLGGEWIYAYEDAAKKAGQEGQYLDFLTQRLTTRTDLPRAERRDGAFRLLSANRKPAAE
jgi:predicted Zn-dependent protease